MKLVNDAVYMDGQETLSIFVKKENGSFEQVEVRMNNEKLEIFTRKNQETRSFSQWQEKESE